jgi:hypothetical protein
MTDASASAGVAWWPALVLWGTVIAVGTLYLVSVERHREDASSPSPSAPLVPGAAPGPQAGGTCPECRSDSGQAPEASPPSLGGNASPSLDVTRGLGEGRTAASVPVAASEGSGAEAPLSAAGPVHGAGPVPPMRAGTAEGPPRLLGTPAGGLQPTGQAPSLAVTRPAQIATPASVSPPPIQASASVAVAAMPAPVPPIQPLAQAPVAPTTAADGAAPVEVPAAGALTSETPTQAPEPRTTAAAPRPVGSAVVNPQEARAFAEAVSETHPPAQAQAAASAPSQVPASGQGPGAVGPSPAQVRSQTPGEAERARILAEYEALWRAAAAPGRPAPAALSPPWGAGVDHPRPRGGWVPAPGPYGSQAYGSRPYGRPLGYPGPARSAAPPAATGYDPAYPGR